MTRSFAQIVGLLLSILGLVSVGCTLALDRWRVAQVGGQGGSSVVATAWFWSDLWKDCHEDSTAVVNCVDFGVLWKVKDVQAVRGLLISGLSLGVVGTALTFLGMECTNIGGETGSNRILTAACVVNLLSCVSAAAGYCLYTNRVVAAFLHSKADPSRVSYEMGPPLYVGLAGSALITIAAVVNWATVCNKVNLKRHYMVPTVSRAGRSERTQREIHGAVIV
ncbi:claudin-10-like isoform 2-T3 [Synchiropus picturatus]